MTDPDPWSKARLVQVEREIRDVQGLDLARLRQDLRRLVEAWFDPVVYASFYLGEP